MHTVTVRLPYLAVGLLAAAVLIPWGVIVCLVWSLTALPRERTAPTPHVTSVTPVTVPRPTGERQSGPWGTLDIDPIMLDYPTSHALYDFDLDDYRRWTFPDSTWESIRQRLAAAGISPADCDKLLATAGVEAGIHGLVLHPPDDMVRALAPTVRRALYTDMARVPANKGQFCPFLFCGTAVSQWFVNSGVSDDVVEMVRPLIYHRDNFLVFSDPQLVVPSITSRVDRVRFYRALCRTAALRVRVLLDANTSRDQLISYWGRPNRTSQIEPLMGILVNDGDGLDIESFLPIFARSHLNTFPEKRQSDDQVVRDCHWAALNFFNDPPDDNIAQNISTLLAQQYRAIGTPEQLGDVVILTSENRLVHSCVYLAGDIVFTKNGVGAGAPLVLDRLDDVVGYYRRIYGDIRLVFVRRKDM